MKFSKLVLVLLLVLALMATMLACGPDPETPPAENPGDNPGDTTPENPNDPGNNPGDDTTDVPNKDDNDHITGAYTVTPIDETTAAITANTGNHTGKLVIPSTYAVGSTTYTVVRIDAGVFADQEDVTEIVVPDTVTEIGQGAFRGCDGVTAITVPFVGGSATSHTYIGYIFGGSSFTENAKYLPKGLATVTLSDACTTVADFAFDNCTSLTALHIGAGVESIGRYTFNGCSLASVTVPAGVNAIGLGAFAGCPVESLTLPFVGADATATVGYIGHIFGAASYTDNSRFVPATLTDVALLNGCNTIGDGAFYGCANLATPVLPDSITAIGNQAFAGTAFYETMADGIVYVGNVLYSYKGELADTAITVKDGTVAIAAGAFSGKSITSIQIPESVTVIGRGAFSGSKLTSLELSFVGESATSSHTHLGYIFGADTAAENALYVPSTLKTVVLRAGCAKIGEGAFFGCGELTGVTVGAGVTSVAKDAFVDCGKLAAITLEGGNSALQSVGGLLYNKAGDDLLAVPGAISGKVTLLHITEIADGMFRGCTGVTEIVLPATLTTLGDEAFKDATKLATVNFADATELVNVGHAAIENTKWYNDKADGELVYTGKVLYKMKGNPAAGAGDVTVQDGTVGIAAGAFENSTVTSVVLPTSVSLIGEGAFAGCNSLTALTVPFVGASNEEGETNMFLGYVFGAPNANTARDYIPASLTAVTVSDGCTVIGSRAFAGCTNVETVILPNSLTEVATDALRDTAYLKNHAPGVVYTGRIVYSFVNHELNYDALAAAIAKGEVEGENIYDVILRPDTVRINDGAFRDSGVHSVRMPDTVTYVGTNAFYLCSTLKDVRLSNGLTDLGAYAFYGCTSLEVIHIPGAMPEDGIVGIGEIKNSTFENCTSLRDVHFNGRLTTIGANAFGNCNTIRNTYWVFDRNEWRDFSTDCDASNKNTIFKADVEEHYDGAEGGLEPNPPYELNV